MFYEWYKKATLESSGLKKTMFKTNNEKRCHIITKIGYINITIDFNFS